MQADRRGWGLHDSAKDIVMELTQEQITGTPGFSRGGDVTLKMMECEHTGRRVIFLNSGEKAVCILDLEEVDALVQALAQARNFLQGN